jgi:hypothetical protein
MTNQLDMISGMSEIGAIDTHQLVEITVSKEMMISQWI